MSWTKPFRKRNNQTVEFQFKDALWSLRQLFATENPSKIIKNAFHFTLKVLFFSRYVNFYSLTFWSCRKTAWSERLKLICKLILPNISRTKGSQTVKVGQFLQYNMRIIFLEKSYPKCDGEAIFRPFSRKSKSLDQQSEFLFSLLSYISKSMNNKI